MGNKKLPVAIGDFHRMLVLAKSRGDNPRASPRAAAAERKFACPRDQAEGAGQPWVSPAES